MKIIGIDPGENGGIAFFDGVKYTVIKMPATPKDILTHLKDLGDSAHANGERIHCILEDVGQGIPNQSSKATAKFSRHIGMLEMALIALEIPYTKVLPSRWMKALSLGTSKQYPTKTAWKNHLKEMAQREFPDIKVTLWSADALLICMYGRRQVL